MKKLFMLTMMIVALASVFAACSNESAPAKAAKTLYEASNDKDYEVAEEYLAKEVYDYAEEKGYSIKEGIDNFTQNGNMKKVKVISEKVKEDQATLVVKVTFNSGYTQSKELPMFLEEGTWKVGLEQ